MSLRNSVEPVRRCSSVTGDEERREKIEPTEEECCKVDHIEVGKHHIGNLQSIPLICAMPQLTHHLPPNQLQLIWRSVLYDCRTTG